MMKITSIIPAGRAAAVAAGMALFLGAGAQENLTNKITIDRIIVPEARAASRINISPELLPARISGKRLNFAEYSDDSDITRSLMFTEPYAWRNTVDKTPWRGYASIGYFPTFNLGASAGYRIVDTRSTTLDAWAQYNGSSYKASWAFDDNNPRSNDTYRQSAIAVGTRLAWRPDSLSALRFGVEYSFSDVEQQMIAPDFNVGVSRLDADIDWASRWRSFDYYIGAGIGMFDFTKDAKFYSESDFNTAGLKATHEFNFHMTGGASMSISDNSRIGIDGKGTILHYNNTNHAGEGLAGEPELVFFSGAGVTRGLLRITPYYQYATPEALVRLGAALDISARSGKAFHVAPDVILQYTFAGTTAVYARFGGGEHLNTLSSLWEHTHYMAPNLSYTNSHIPFTVKAGVNISQYFGIYGAYARANEWLMPMTVDNCVTFTPIDMRGWMAGAWAAYSFRNLVSAKASFEIADKGMDKGWYLWRDRARYVGRFEIEGRPIQKLTVNAALEMRMKREGMTAAAEGTELVSLNDCALLSLGGVYTVSERFSAYARLENLLNRHYFNVSGVPEQGIHGLVGVNYKF